MGDARLVRAGLAAFALPLRQPLRTAHGEISARHGHLVSLEDEAGYVGFGEATPLEGFGTESPVAARAALIAGIEALLEGPATAARDIKEARAEVDAGRLETVARVVGADAPCARSALECALHDLAARRDGQSLAARLACRAGRAGIAPTQVRVQCLLAAVPPEVVAREARAARSRGFDAFKLKVGVGSASLDLARVAALRAAIGPEAKIRLDANEAWSLAEAQRRIPDLAAHDIDFLEQPVPGHDHAALARLERAGPIAMAADEALLGLGAGMDAFLAGRPCSVLVVKPAALGGVERAVALAQSASRAGLRLVWSNLIEGRVGRSLALSLAGALGDPAERHGLATADLLALDLPSSRAAGDRAATTASPIAPCGGAIALDAGPGLGFAPRPAWSASGEPFGETTLREAPR